MNKGKNNEKTDADILRCRADILHARDIMPPYNKKARGSSDSRNTDENANLSAAAKPSVVTTVNHKPAITHGELACPELVEWVEPTNQHKKHEIPKFDLAEEIMAEQRRITAVKRKAPAKKIETVSPPLAVDSAALLRQPKPLVQEQIIAEIVARDIEKLCRGDMPDVHRQDFEDIAKGAEQNTPPRL